MSSKLISFVCYKNGEYKIFMNIKMKFSDAKEAKRLFEKLPFYASIEKTRIKNLKNIYLLHERLFYDKLSIEKISKAFKRYERSYRNEIVDSKDPLV